MDTSAYIVIFVGLAFIVGSIFLILRQYFFLKKRCTAQVGGNILYMGRNENHYDDDSPTTVSYSVKYRYYVDGVEYSKKRKVSKRTYKSMGPSSTSNFDITVFYDPSKPKRHYVLEIKFRIIRRLFLIALITALLIYYYYWVLDVMI